MAEKIGERLADITLIAATFLAACLWCSQGAFGAASSDSYTVSVSKPMPDTDIPNILEEHRCFDTPSRARTSSAASSSSSSQENSNGITIVHDLDSVLIHHVENWENYPQENKEFYMHHGLHRSIKFSDPIYEDQHYFLPGFFDAYIRYIMKKGYEFHFFSAGGKERNELIIPKLLEDDRFHYFQQRGSVLASGNDCNVSSSGQYSKNLNTILQNSSDLKNVVLIDDNTNSVYPGQEKNLLLVPSHEFHKETMGSKKDYSENTSVTMQHLDFYKLLYIVGLLETASEKANTDKQQITETLKKLQGSTCIMHRECIFGPYSSPVCIAKFIENSVNLDFYKKGYYTLQQILKDTEEEMPSYFPAIEEALFHEKTTTSSSPSILTTISSFFWFS